MISRTIAAAVLTATLVTCGASAQTTTANKTDRATVHRDGEWRASKLVGVNVYNEAAEKIGDINDVILDKSGKTSKVILGVGGFLGMGEYNVAVPFEKLKWVNQPVRSAASSSNPPASAPATNVDSNARTASDGAARTTTGTATNPSAARDTSRNWYPDHAVYNATKDQLKAMPEFKY
jgi:sporulation protein YlmC with PRC-barrel domain